MKENGRVHVRRALELGLACAVGAVALAVAAPASAQNLNVTGSTTTGSLTVSGASTTGSLTVNGATALTGGATTGSLTVTGPTVLLGSPSVAGDGFTLYGPNTTWGAYLQVGGNGRTVDRASVVATDGNLHLDPLAVGAHALYLNYYANTNTNVGQGSGPYKLNVFGDIIASNPSGSSWIRTGGVGGWYNETYGGGWYMADTSWIRSYNNKLVYMSAGFDTGSPSGIGCGGGLGNGSTFRVCGTAMVEASLRVGVGAVSTSGLGPRFSARGGTGDQSTAIITSGLTDASGFFRNNTDWPAGWAGGIATWDVLAQNIRYSGLSQRSDARLKTDVASLDESATAKLLALRPVSYKWKDKNADRRTHFGFIAQEVETVLPDLITKGSDVDETLAMDYQDLTAFLVKATQQLKSENDELRRRLEALERAR